MVKVAFEVFHLHDYAAQTKIGFPVLVEARGGGFGVVFVICAASNGDARRWPAGILKYCRPNLKRQARDTSQRETHTERGMNSEYIHRGTQIERQVESELFRVAGTRLSLS